jgi:hypothetical protein
MLRPMRLLRRLLALVVLVILIGVGIRYFQDDEGDGAQETEEARITECALNDIGYLEATVLLTNTTSRDTSYNVVVAAESADGSEQFDTSLVSASRLRPGQTTRLETTFLRRGVPPSAKCVVRDITKY